MNNNFIFKDKTNLSKKFFFLGVFSSILAYVGYLNNIEHFYHSYLVSFMFWVTLSCGCMFFVMVHYTMNATWSVSIRRIAETSMSLIPFLSIFIIPLYFGMEILYEWIEHPLKESYLNKNFFILRTLFYLIIWSFLSSMLYHYSVSYKSDESLIKLRKYAGVGTFVFALTISFAAFDWLMTLDPHWYSTMFGVYIFAGSFLVAVVFIVLVLLFLQNTGNLNNEVNLDHFVDLGRIMFGFTVFWAYIAGFQYYLIWYGNLPEEIEWYLARSHGTWMVLTYLLIFGHFVIPFIILLFNKSKRILSILGALAILALFMHWCDLYWNVLPNLHHDTIVFNWTDITVFLALSGFYLSLFFKRLSQNPLVPIKDPRLDASIKGDY
tara:strand:+ start:784 stop:1920 length:1137 start_codon:yes stop_codon:yes gene_type:complete